METQLGLFDYQGHEEAKLQWVDLSKCVEHPLNPRLSFDEEQIGRIAELIQQFGYKPEHAILVRPVNEHFEIVSGHHRVEACRQVGMEKILAWVNEDLSNEKAHSLLLLENDQSELSALEKGKHAYEHIQEFGTPGVGAGAGNTGGLSEYAKQHGRDRQLIDQWMRAYKVVIICKNLAIYDLRVSSLYEISKSPDTAWQPLCNFALDEEWTVNQTKRVVKKIKEIKIGDDDYGYNLQEIYEKAAKNKGSLINRYKDLFATMKSHLDDFDKEIELYKWQETDEERERGHQIQRKWTAVPYKYHPRDEFLTLIETNLPLKPKTVDKYAGQISNEMTENREGGEKWVSQRTKEEIKQLERAEQIERKKEFLDNAVIQGDSFKVFSELPKKHFDALITDPPYGQGTAEWDEVEPVGFTVRWVELCLPLLKDKHQILIFCSSDFQACIETALAEIIETPLQSHIIWFKRNIIEGRSPEEAFIKSHEVILHYGNKPLNFDEDWTDERFDVMEFAVPQRNFEEDEGEHRTQKPLELMQRLIDHTITEDDKVLDPFAGSGTTGVAVLRAGGIPTLIEQNGDYVTIIRRRLQGELGEAILS